MATSPLLPAPGYDINDKDDRSPPAKQDASSGAKDWVAVESELVGEVVLFVRDQDTAVPVEHASAVRYTVSELEKIQNLSESTLRAVHAAKKALGGMVASGEASEPEGPAGALAALKRAARGLGAEHLLCLTNDPMVPALDQAVYAAEAHRRAAALVEESQGHPPPAPAPGAPAADIPPRPLAGPHPRLEASW